jgi:hypothetical protein
LVDELVEDLVPQIEPFDHLRGQGLAELPLVPLQCVGIRLRVLFHRYDVPVDLGDLVRLATDVRAPAPQDEHDNDRPEGDICKPSLGMSA